MPFRFRRRRAAHVRVAATFAALALLAAPGDAAAQFDAEDCAAELSFTLRDVAGVHYDYTRAAETAGATSPRAQMFRRGSAPGAVVCTGLPWQHAAEPIRTDRDFEFTQLPVRWLGAYNSAYAVDENNGALRAGRGPSAALQAGTALRWGPVSIAAAPVITWAEDRSFSVPLVALPGFDEGIYAGHPGRIDWPYPLEEESDFIAHPGQSYIRVDAYGAAAGVSTENLWWGTGTRYTPLLSNTAAGFPHVFVGTSAPADVRIGRVEAELFWGRLDESERFDADAGNDRRLLAGAAASYGPKWLPGLHLGIARLYLGNAPRQGFGAADWLLVPYGRDHPYAGDAAGFGAGQHYRSLMARWVFQPAALELYVEHARVTRAGVRADSLRDGSDGVLLGVSRIFGRGQRWVRLFAEVGETQNELDLRTGLATATFYADDAVRQGLTHRGQLLGSALGPGADFFVAGVDIFHFVGATSVYVQRAGYDDDAFYEQLAARFGFLGHDVGVRAGFRQAIFSGPLGLVFEAETEQRRNRALMYGASERPGEFTLERNWRFGLLLEWNPAR